MKKSSFFALIAGIISEAVFALGCCATFLPAIQRPDLGTVLIAAGIVLGLVTFFGWRRMEKMPPLRIHWKALLSALAGIVGIALQGAGVYLALTTESLILGVLLGLAGIILLLCLIPLNLGLE